jgi:SAM-dependent methyltransferase
MKRYDRAYFDRWYRNPETRIRTGGELRYKAALVVATAELVLGRRVRSVLDVGCGEARWLPELKRIRPAVRYTGLDSSTYVVERFGRTRNIRAGSFASLGEKKFRGQFDVVICADVMHYLDEEELRKGLAAIPSILRGIAYFDIAVTEDEPEGDLKHWKDRPASWYRTEFENAGLVDLGMQCWGATEARIHLSALEIR